MRLLPLLICFLYAFVNANAQLLLSANSSNGTAYQNIESVGLEIESPDCEHTSFGDHVSQETDQFLGKEVFVFHSHIDDDNDRCQVFDRVRMEIKGGPNSTQSAQHTQGSESFYRWKFQLPSDFKGASSFCHIFQNKIKGGDDNLPVLTITVRTSFVELRHLGGDSGDDLGTLVRADLDKFTGRWVEVYLHQLHDESGQVDFSVKDMLTGNVIMTYSNTNIDLWRAGGEYSRPKWGMYRAKANTLKDETIKFADFCISETSEAQCPTDPFVFVDTVAPTVPTNLVASHVQMSSLDLTWDASDDFVGVVGYNVYLDGMQFTSSATNVITLDNLTGSTTYTVGITAHDAAGNESDLSQTITVTTDDINSLPEAVSNPRPDDQAVRVLSPVTLSWSGGKNTDSYKLYFGKDGNTKLVYEGTNDEYTTDLEADATYQWQVVGVNTNGQTDGPLWSFTSASANSDGDWLVYRANDRLDKETTFYETLDIPANPSRDLIVDDINGSPNKFYQYHEEGDEKFRWRYRLEPTYTAFTVVGRIKALNEDVNCICYFEVKAFGWREKIRINQSTIKLERSSPIVESSWPDGTDITNEWHVFRMTMAGNVTKVYIDENSTPIAIGNSNDDDTNAFFEFGKSGNNECGGQVDWLAILPNTSAAPDQGPSLPSDLFLSSDATLSSIQVNGEDVKEFHPDTMLYIIEFAQFEDVPTVTYTTTSELSTSVLNKPSTVPNTSTTIEVTAQDGWTTQTYEIAYILLLKTDDGLENLVKIYPNPTSNRLVIDAKGQTMNKIALIDALGREVLSRFHTSFVEIDVHNLVNGTYVTKLTDDEGRVLTKTIIINK